MKKISEADEIKKQLEELKAQKAKLEKVEKSKPKKAAKPEKPKKAAKPEKPKKEEKIEPKTPEEELEEQFSDEQIRNFKIEKKDMDKITHQVCELLVLNEEKGMLQNDLWKKLKLSARDGARLALRLERRGLISREKLLQKGRWTYNLIIEQTPISLESLQNLSLIHI